MRAWVFYITIPIQHSKVLFQDRIMKKRNYAYIFIGGLICSSCLFNRKVNINGHVFETLKKHAYGSSKIIFHKDSSYIFLGQGPSVLLSKGKWSYNYFENEISFKASSPDSNFLSSISMDTI